MVESKSDEELALEMFREEARIARRLVAMSDAAKKIIEMRGGV